MAAEGGREVAVGLALPKCCKRVVGRIHRHGRLSAGIRVIARIAPLEDRQRALRLLDAYNVTTVSRRN